MEHTNFTALSTCTKITIYPTLIDSNIIAEVEIQVPVVGYRYTRTVTAKVDKNDKISINEIITYVEGEAFKEYISKNKGVL
jgi:hypothetical protein